MSKKERLKSEIQRLEHEKAYLLQRLLIAEGHSPYDIRELERLIFEVATEAETLRLRNAVQSAELQLEASLREAKRS